MHGRKDSPRADDSTSRPDDRPADDLKHIPGVGRAIERRLHEAGIRTFGELAEHSPDQLAQLTGVPVHRAKGWPDRARALGGATPEAAGSDEPEQAEDRQHYESFTLRLLLDDRREVRRLHLVHVQSGRERTWPSWETGELLDVLVEQASLRIPAPTPSRSQVAPARSEGEARLKEPTIVTAASEHPGMMVAADTPFTVRVVLDLRDVAEPGGLPIEYAATFVAKRLGGKSRQTIGELNGKAEAGDEVALELTSCGLPAGTYRLNVIARVGHVGAERPNQLAALLDGALLHVS
jgi:predicted flap endonuclease-1-like 5' DNA nuclease